MEIDTLYTAFKETSGICTDTRNISENCLFVALKGTHFNGNEFAREALDKGARYALIDAPEHKVGDRTLLVPDALTALQKLATHHRKKLGLPLLALTGSNGKTTTKELIAAVLSKKYRVTATKGNLNNHIGVPLTLLSISPQTEMGIIEMGANHQGEIAALCDIAKPDYGYITNFGKAHLEGFGGIEGVVKGKTELYRHLKANAKTVFVNGHDDKQLHHSEGMKRHIFNTEGPLEIALVDASNEVTISFQDTEIKSQLVGLYNYHNLAAAVAVGHYFEVPVEGIKQAIEGYAPQNNRSQRLTQNGHTILLDAYNANPTSMMAALENFKQTGGSNKVLILGDMFELGVDTSREHQNITTYLEKHPFGKVFLVGSHFAETQTAAAHITQFKTYGAFAEYLRQHPLEKATLLIKGSRGMALERSLELL